MSESNRYRLAYVAESSYGVTPANPVAKIITTTGASLSRSKSTVQSNDIRADAQVAAIPQVSVSLSGETPIEFRSAAYNTLIAAALRCAPGTTLTNGILTPSFTLEEAFTDVGQFRLWKGMRVGSMSLSASVGAIVTGSFGWMGLTETDDETGLVIGSGSRTAASTNTPWNATANVASVTIGGVQTTVCVQSFDLSINNNLRDQLCIGSENPVATPYGTMAITGNLKGIFDAWDELYDTFKAHTPIALAFSFVGAEGDTTTITLPNTYLTTGTVNPGGVNSDVAESYGFQAVPNQAGTSIQIVYAAATS